MADTRRIKQKDWVQVADFIVKEKEDRKSRRKDLEAAWKEIDRQVAMSPTPRGVDEGGKKLVGKEWLPEIELPLQAQALEVLTADTRRLLFPDDRSFFSANSEVTDKLLGEVDFTSIISGDEVQVPTKFQQDNFDALVEGVLTHCHSLYDHRGVWDEFNAENFKYGTGILRARLVSLDKFQNDFRGVRSDTIRFPRLYAVSVKNTYLDDSANHTLHEGVQTAPSVIREYSQSIDDLRRAAKKGSTDPTKEDGGWMPSKLANLEPDKNNNVSILEFEGDLAIPRSQGKNIFLPNVIVSVAVGAERVVFRYRERAFPFRSYLYQNYHRDQIDTPYGVSPLMKGLPLQKAATESANRWMEAVVLDSEPPVVWDPQDQWLQGTGGPQIYPGALWAGLTKPEPVKIGDVGALGNAFTALANLHNDVTGVNAPRLGAQTVSHTTAFAKDQEIGRGLIRTVDYARSVMYGAMNTWLHMEYEMVKATLKDEQPLFLPKYGGWVKVSNKHLPENVAFDIHGSAEPLEEREANQKKTQGMQLALQLEEPKIQTGGKPMDYEQIQETILRDAGYVNTDGFFAGSPEGLPQEIAPGADIPGIDGGDALPMPPGLEAPLQQ